MITGTTDGFLFADDLQQFSGAGVCDLAAKVSIGRYRFASVAELISRCSSAEAALIHPRCERLTADDVSRRPSKTDRFQRSSQVPGGVTRVADAAGADSRKHRRCIRRANAFG